MRYDGDEKKMNGLSGNLWWILILGLIISVCDGLSGKMGSEVYIGSVHRFLWSQNEKPTTEPNKFGLDWFSSVFNQTRQNQIHFRFNSVWTFGFVQTAYTQKTQNYVFFLRLFIHLFLIMPTWLLLMKAIQYFDSLFRKNGWLNYDEF